MFQVVTVLEKNFDKVPHRRLLYKLDYYGIRGSTHKWIISWLSERFQKVVLDGQASDPVPVLSGVLKDRSQGRSYFSFLLMIFQKISGHLFVFLLTIVSCIGTLNPPWTVRFYKMT